MRSNIKPIVLGLIFLPILIACGGEPESVLDKDPPRPVKVHRLNLHQVSDNRIFNAEVQASEHAELSFQVSGEVNEIYVKSGQYVQKGELIASVDSAIYEQEHQVAKADFSLAKVLYERAKILIKNNFISQYDFDQIKSNYDTTKAALNTRNNRLDYTNVYAPFNGVVSTRYVERFQFVTENQPVVGLQGKENLDVLFQLPDQFITAFQRQREHHDAEPEVLVRFSKRDDWHTALLKEFSTVADSTTASFSVVVQLPTPKAVNVIPGMNAEVRISIPTDTMTKEIVPSGAILHEGENQYVYRLSKEKNVVDKVAVIIDSGELKEGVVDGDWIVVAGIEELIHGQKVVPWVKERGL